MSSQLLRQLTLMRHAHAEAKQPAGTDLDRSLDRRGLAEAAEMARRLFERDLRPDLLFISTAVRTRQTAAPIERAFALTAYHVRLEPELYLAEPATLLHHLRTVPADTRHVLLVGHNPGISELARLLSSHDAAAEFEPGGMLLASLRSESWDQIGPGSIASMQYDAPRIPFDLDG